MMFLRHKFHRVPKTSAASGWPYLRSVAGISSLWFGLQICLPTVSGAELAAAVTEVRSDIEQAADDLVALRKTIGEEQKSLAGDIEERRAELRQLQEQLAVLTTTRHATEAERNELEARVRHLFELVDYLRQMAVDARQQLEARIAASALPAYQERLDHIDSLIGADDPALLPQILSELLPLYQDECMRLTGGNIYPGQALKPDGEVVDGMFAQFGPAVYFAAKDPHGPAGLVVQLPGSLLPTVYTGFTVREAKAVRQLLTGNERTMVPVDVTAGAALQLRKSHDTLWGHLRKGRAIMFPLLALGAFCAVLAVYKVVQLSRVLTRKSDARIAEIVEHLKAGNIETAERLALGLRKPLGAVILEGIRHRDVAKEHLEEVMYEKLILQSPELERFLAPLAVSASAAPLLGLLGTVTGMIHTFQLITVFGSGDAKLLSAGISEALVTTEVGLVVAIPALLIHAFLSRRVRRAVTLTQQSAVAFVNAMTLQKDDSGGTDIRRNAQAKP
jgi:biopolymer transport protein ExbB